ncbi:MAG: ferredoxin-NADP reductase [Rhodospirillaceae bacterium]|nr:ferredoxin-NADP reductase [Rhodospirillaceae bacterium]
MTLKIAVVGSGPAGFYTADAILRSGSECEIDIFERFPCPFGLIRFGVAPDHEKTRSVWRAFTKTLGNESVRYFGNITVGQDISVDELLLNYNAVVITVGAGKDQPLNIPGADLEGVYGSATFVNWYNGHPDEANLSPNLNTNSVVVIGAGNVAIDVARVLLKTKQEMANTDLSSHAAKIIHSSPIREVHLVARRSAAEAKFTNVELREMGDLDEADPYLDAKVLPISVEGEMSDRDRRVREKNLITLREFAEIKEYTKPKKLNFLFCAQPVEIKGTGKAEAVIFERTRIENGKAIATGNRFQVPCGIVVAATGYRSEAVPGVPFDEKNGIIPNVMGRVSEGLYVAGWVKRGPSGVIGTNKTDARETVENMLKDLMPQEKSGRKAIDVLLTERGCRVVNFADWQKIQQAEENAATGGAPRAKFVNVRDMIDVLENSN